MKNQFSQCIIKKRFDNGGHGYYFKILSIYSPAGTCEEKDVIIDRSAS